LSTLVVFAREPVAGRVKTRLARRIGDEATLALYRAFLEDVVALSEGVAERRLLRVAGDPESLAGLPIARAPQQGADLGARMVHAIRASLGEGPVAIIGTDSPTLPREFLAEAFARLQKHDVVLGPSTDGGYWLIGTRVAIPEIFEGIAWSTPEVLPETLRRLAGRDYSLLPSWYDVDEEADLEYLRLHLRSLPGGVAPATRRVLAR
jgi:hypothetical protein